MTRLLVPIVLLVIVCNVIAIAQNPNNFNALDDVNAPKVRHSKKYNSFIDSYLYDLQYCRRPAKCEALNYTVCLGAELPYSTTTLELTDLENQQVVQKKLNLFYYLRYIPKCWAVIQPFLCALYMPKCIDGQVDLPSKEMCKITLEPCKIFYNNSDFLFADFLNCEDERLFPTKCRNDVLEVKFNTTGYCMSPLVKTDEIDSFYSDVEGCGLQCNDYLYNEEYSQIHKLIAGCVVICLLLNLFTILTFTIDWKSLNKYPAKAIFYVTICCFVSYIGWLIQFLGNETREDIVCNKDGTLRKSEPRANENLSCVVIFVFVYYFSIASMVWFVIFSYTWNKSSLKALGKSHERVNKNRAYFHIIAWSLPLILTITTMALGEIDGDYLTGICFVGFFNMTARGGLLLAPLVVTMLVSGYFIIKEVILLQQIRNESREIISEHANRKIRHNIVRMIVVGLFMVVFSLITIVYHVYIYVNSETWTNGLHKYILCKLTSFSNDFSHCKYDSKPSVAMLQLQLLSVFGAGIPMTTWVWRSTTVGSWRRYLKMKFHCGKEKPTKMAKHKIIAEAFAKHQKYPQRGRIYVDRNMYRDPLGLSFDLDSADSNDISSTWQKNLQRLLTRRDAVLPSDSSKNDSVDSETNLSLRHVSIESRQSSGESKVSVQISELKATRKVNRHGHRNQRKNRRRSSRNYRDSDGSNRKTESSKRDTSQSSDDSQLSVQITKLKTRKVNTHRHQNRNKYRRRKTSLGSIIPNIKVDCKCESNTSLDSQLQILKNLANNYNSIKGPNLNRRNAITGLDGVDIYINKMFPNKQGVIPYNATNDQNVKISCSNVSDDENASLTMSCS